MEYIKDGRIVDHKGLAKWLGYDLRTKEAREFIDYAVLKEDSNVIKVNWYFIPLTKGCFNS